MNLVALVALLTSAGCKKNKDEAAGEPSPLLSVEETERWSLPGLGAEVYVMRTEGSVPYLYAEDRVDLARASGFVVARDRYFMMDMIRRLSRGRLSELLGDAALSVDQESRALGMSRVADRMRDQFEADPYWSEILGAYAEGINHYVVEVRNNRLPVPSEYASLGPVLGRADPKEMLTDFELADMAAIGATFVYELGFETGDVGRQASFEALPEHYVGAPLEALRSEGLLRDVWERVEPVHGISSAPGWGAARRGTAPRASGTPSEVHVPRQLLARLGERLERFERRLGHDHESGFGSNAWAVAGSHTADGRSLMAGDGHLPLSIPSLFYSVGMDTAHLGVGELTQVGLVIPGLPTLAVGTNGRVAWGQTQLFGDITDWYREELQLGDDGAPSASRFDGQWRPLVAVPETYEIADVALLGSVGRTETWTRWETFDGRLITEIEGIEVDDDHSPGPGEAVISVMGQRIVPQDTDGDGVITAISFDHTGLDSGNLVLASDAFGQATDVHDLQEQTQRLVAYSQNIVASDAAGDVLYTGYQAVPCRSYLPKNPDGSWMQGADPSMLLDGTRYGGFEIPLVDGFVDESQAADPYRCLVPFAEYPQVVSPPGGYVLTANNDPGHISTDGSLLDDPHYIGGPWLEGFRAQRIDEVLAEAAAGKTADIASMAALQGDHQSTVAALWLPVFLEALDRARALAEGAAPEPDSSEERIVATYLADEVRMLEVYDRLSAWQDAGMPARAGVETFYLSVEPDDPQHAVATTIWNVWVGHAVRGILDDEGWSGVYQPTSDSGRTRTLKRMFDGRGPGNPEDMASYNPQTQESAFFDDLNTPQIETSDEILIRTLADALQLLSEPPTADAEGGFGTDDMDAWLWGLRHMVRFESLLGEVLEEDDGFGFIVDLFSITPETLPLAEALSADDPRKDLPWFPRHGDHLNVDAGNTGFSTTRFSYGSGPVFRMVIALGPDGAEGVNILPGGQSGIRESPYWSDQAALWLGNETWPLHTSVEDVIGASTHRETLAP